MNALPNGAGSFQIEGRANKPESIRLQNIFLGNMIDMGKMGWSYFYVCWLIGQRRRIVAEAS